MSAKTISRTQRLVGTVVTILLVSSFPPLSCLSASGSPKPTRVSFQPSPGSPFRVGAHPAAIAVADVNGDGKEDILTANTGSDDVSVLLGDGRGGFRNAPGSPFPAGPKPHLLAIGNLNDDRRPDVALTEHDSNDVRVFLGTGDGRFSKAPGSPFVALRETPPHNHGLSLGDVNGDRFLDIATSNQNHGSVSVLLGSGKGSFTPAPGSPFPVGRDPYPHALGDLNGDGRLDVVSPNVRGNSASVLIGDGRGGFTPAAGSPYAVTARPYFAALGDLNGDKRLDIVTTHDDTSVATVLLGDGKGRFNLAPGSPFDVGVRGWAVRLGDVNGDSRVDMITSGAHGLVVMLGDGRGRFTRSPGPPHSVGRGAWNIVLTDLNRDGKLDVATTNSEDSSVSVLLGGL